MTYQKEMIHQPPDPAADVLDVRTCRNCAGWFFFLRSESSLTRFLRRFPYEEGRCHHRRWSAGIFTAIEMLKKGSKQNILIVEKGKAVEDRHCPKSQTKQCVNCKPYCHITTGFSVRGLSPMESCL